MADRFDVVVIGAGPGGYVAAIRAAQLGKKVACIDRRAAAGGTCLNIGCIPSKALLDSSEQYTVAKSHLATHGINVGDVGLDLGRMMQRKDKIVKGLTDGVAYLFKKNNVAFIHGSARLGGKGKVLVKGSGRGGDKTLQADAIILATGSEPASLPALPFDGTNIVSSTDALSFDKVPSHLLVVGGGYIGLELGSVWARLGAKVTVVEFLPRIVPQMDAEIAQQLQRSLVKQGLKIDTDTRIVSASTQAGRVVLTAQAKGERVYQADKVLVAVGRRPCTTGLGLEEIGVQVDAKSGRVPVNATFQTNVAGVYAIGDLIPGPMLAHKAEDEGVATAEFIAGRKGHVNYATIPSVIYTWPEVASVGLTEEQVKDTGREYRVGKFPFSANGRARCLDETEGMVKILADAKTDRVLGVHIFGPRASDMIAEAVVAMEYAASAEDIARTCHPHPTLTEAVREAALAVDGRAIHI